MAYSCTESLETCRTSLGRSGLIRARNARSSGPRWWCCVFDVPPSFSLIPRGVGYPRNAQTAAERVQVHADVRVRADAHVRVHADVPRTRSRPGRRQRSGSRRRADFTSTGDAQGGDTHGQGLRDMLTGGLSQAGFRAGSQAGSDVGRLTGGFSRGGSHRHALTGRFTGRVTGRLRRGQAHGQAHR
jgi:hypothetical protein